MRLRLEPMLKLHLVELGIIKATELRGQSAKCQDQLELPGYSIGCQINPRPAGEVEPGLGLSLHFGKRIAAGEKMRQEMMTGKAGVVQIADLLRRVESPPQPRTACPDIPGPATETKVDAGLEAV